MAPENDFEASRNDKVNREELEKTNGDTWPQLQWYFILTTHS